MAVVRSQRKKRSYGSRYKRRNPYTRAKRVVRRRRKAIVNVPRALIPLPERKLVRHKYIENISLSGAAAGLCSFHAIRCNSVFDPNKTGVGHQPLYRDEMAANYTSYTVIASYIRVIFDQTSTNFENRGIIVSEDTSFPNSPETFQELYPTVVPAIPGQRNSPEIRRASWNAAKWYKTTTRAIMADDDKKTASGSNPANSVDFVIWRGPVSTAVALGACLAQVEVIYITMWRDISNITGS